MHTRLMEGDMDDGIIEDESDSVVVGTKRMAPTTVSN